MSKKYWALTFLATFIVLPAWLNGCLLLFGMGAGRSHDGWLLLQALAVALLLFEFWAIYRFGKKAVLPDGFLPRYAPFIAAIVYVLLAWLVVAWLSGGDFQHHPEGLFAFLPFFIFVLLVILAVPYGWLPVVIIATYLIFMACFALGTWRGKRLRTSGNEKGLYALTLAVLLAGAATTQSYAQYQRVLHPDDAYPEMRAEDGFLYWEYQPFSVSSRLFSPTQPSLRISGDYPRLVGATALIPVYAAAANAIYQADESGKAAREAAVNITDTSSPAVYQALIDDKADIVFAAAPSEEQVKDAAAHGLTYTITPIGREAFVFLVNERNPVTSLSVEQIRGIYSGKINDWRDLGGSPGAIMAFQRNEGSGSQTAMQRLVMQGLPMRQPLEAERHGDMGGLVRGVAAYRNTEQAIGYSFRYYTTTMNKVAGIRLLAVNQIAPSPENIYNGSYPFTGDIVMVTARPLSPNAKKLHDWFLSDEGRQFIEAAGYVSLRSQ